MQILNTILKKFLIQHTILFLYTELSFLFAVIKTKQNKRNSLKHGTWVIVPTR